MCLLSENIRPSRCLSVSRMTYSRWGVMLVKSWCPRLTGWEAVLFEQSSGLIGSRDRTVQQRCWSNIHILKMLPGNGSQNNWNEPIVWAHKWHNKKLKQILSVLNWISPFHPRPSVPDALSDAAHWNRLLSRRILRRALLNYSARRWRA